MNRISRFPISRSPISRSPIPRSQTALLGAVMVLFTASASAALQGRNLDANPATFEAYYDTVLNITWLADADIANTRGEANAGRKTWSAASAYVAALDVNGITGWRLPKVLPRDGSTVYNGVFTNNGTSDRGYANTGVGWGTTSELGHMFYVTLANSAFSLTNTAPFSNLAANDYWTNQPLGAIATQGFFFNTGIGLQDTASLAFTYKAWAVRDGDISAPIPEPETYALMLLGLAATAVVARRRR
jgi:PEP-CTERM motif